MYVIAHFHAFILFSIVPAGFAALYLMIAKRMWYSAKMVWVHFWGYTIGTVMLVMGYDYLGVTGLIRREEIYPLTPTFITGQLIATAGAVIANIATVIATVVWLINLVLTLVKGRTMETEGLSLGQLTTSVALALSSDSDILSMSFIKGLNFIKSEVSSLVSKKKL